MKRFTDEDRESFTQILTSLARAYRQKLPLDSDFVRVYELGLCDMSIPEIQKAALKHLKVSKWFPSVSELRPRVTEAEIARIRDGRAREHRAWRQLKDIRSKGPSTQTLLDANERYHDATKPLQIGQILNVDQD